MNERVPVDMTWERSEHEKRMAERLAGKRPMLPEPVIFPTGSRRTMQLSAMGFAVNSRGGMGND